MKLQIIKTYEFDDAKERNRILKHFEGEIQAKLLNILDLFLAGEYNRMFEAYDALGYDKESECPEAEDALGYDKESECPEAEFVGMYLMDLYDLLRTYPSACPLKFRDSKLVPISVDKITNVGNTTADATA